MTKENTLNAVGKTPSRCKYKKIGGSMQEKRDETENTEEIWRKKERKTRDIKRKMPYTRLCTAETGKNTSRVKDAA